MTRILVVDDSSVDRKIAGGLLSQSGEWSVDFASDGREAFESLQSMLPDVIVTDLQMPEMDGLELVKAVKKSYPLVAVVLMTGKGSETIAVQALQQGAASYVPKKQMADMLVDTVRRVMALAGQRRTKKTLMEQLTAVHYRFRLGNDPIVLTSLVSHVQGLLGDMGVLSESERLRTGVALEEALLNAAYHGNLEVSSRLRETDHAAFYELARQRMQLDPYCRRTIEVDVTIDERGLRYIICDQGPGFDPHSLPDPKDPANLDRPCGRGVLLMKTFMDEVRYNELGNQVTLLKMAGPCQLNASTG